MSDSPIPATLALPLDEERTLFIPLTARLCDLQRKCRELEAVALTEIEGREAVVMETGTIVIGGRK